MSAFFSPRLEGLAAYVPGEQPRDQRYVKLNTNESPFSPAPGVAEAVRAAAEGLNLYSDPDCGPLTRALAERFCVPPQCVLLGNGSDENLSLAFQAFCGDGGVAFADITYGFYKVFAALYRVPAHIVPLRADFSLALADYQGFDCPVFIANPNAPTGMNLGREEIEAFAAKNPRRLVVVDEAYVDFGGESCVPLTQRYDNLCVVGTFSKSRSLAGARLGYTVACQALIDDLQKVRCSVNPYNVNAMTQAAGLAALRQEDYTRENCRVILENRAYTQAALKKLGFECLPSSANFLFVRRPGTPGKELYLALRRRGVLVRHFDAPRIADYLRITIGDKGQMDALLSALAAILA